MSGLTLTDTMVQQFAHPLFAEIDDPVFAQAKHRSLHILEMKSASADVVSSILELAKDLAEALKVVAIDRSTFLKHIQLKIEAEVQVQFQVVLAAISVSLFLAAEERPPCFEFDLAPDIDSAQLLKVWSQWRDFSKAQTPLAPMERRADGFAWVCSDTSQECQLARLACAAATLRHGFSFLKGQFDQPSKSPCVSGTELIIDDGELIDRSVPNSKIDLEMTPGSRATQLEIAARWVDEGFKVAAVSAASAVQVSGGFLTGAASALEESMCMQSTLFFSLQKAQRLAEKRNVTDASGKRIHVPECGVVVSPNVHIFRRGVDHGYAPRGPAEVTAVLSVAMPNKNPKWLDHPLEPREGDDYEHLLEQKFQALLWGAVRAGARILIMPEIGCGALGNDPVVVGKAFGKSLHRFGGLLDRVLVMGRPPFYQSVRSAYAVPGAWHEASSIDAGPKLTEISRKADPQGVDLAPSVNQRSRPSTMPVLQPAGEDSQPINDGESSPEPERPDIPRVTVTAAAPAKKSCHSCMFPCYATEPRQSSELLVNAKHASTSEARLSEVRNSQDPCSDDLPTMPNLPQAAHASFPQSEEIQTQPNLVRDETQPSLVPDGTAANLVTDGKPVLQTRLDLPPPAGNPSFGPRLDAVPEGQDAVHQTRVDLATAPGRGVPLTRVDLASGVESHPKIAPKLSSVPVTKVDLAANPPAFTSAKKDAAAAQPTIQKQILAFFKMDSAPVVEAAVPKTRVDLATSNGSATPLTRVDLASDLASQPKPPHTAGPTPVTQVDLASNQQAVASAKKDGGRAGPNTEKESARKAASTLPPMDREWQRWWCARQLGMRMRAAGTETHKQVGQIVAQHDPQQTGSIPVSRLQQVLAESRNGAKPTDDELRLLVSESDSLQQVMPLPKVLEVLRAWEIFEVFKEDIDVIFNLYDGDATGKLDSSDAANILQEISGNNLSNTEVEAITKQNSFSPTELSMMVAKWQAVRLQKDAAVSATTKAAECALQ